MTYFGQNGFISTDNSTTTPLSSGATYTGTGEQNFFNQVGVMLKTDNTGTLYFDFSSDGTNWDSTFPSNGFKVASGVSEFHTAVKLPGRYFRVRLVNDTGAQTYLRLTTYYGNNIVPSVSPLNQTIGLDSDAQIVRPTDHLDEATIGRYSGVEVWTKFGYNDDVDSAATEVLWPDGAAFTPLDSAETFDIAYDGTAGGSTDGNGTNGATQLTFYYVDSDGNPAIATHNLGTDGSDTTSFSGFGINRVAVSASGSDDANASDITITATTSLTQQAIIKAGESVTQQLIFFNGSNHKAIVKSIFLNVNKLSGGGTPRVTIKGWIYNRAIQTNFLVYRFTKDSSVENTTSDIVRKIRLNETDVLYFTATTTVDNTVVDMGFSVTQYQNT